jgi:hypothetical protein
MKSFKELFESKTVQENGIGLKKHNVGDVFVYFTVNGKAYIGFFEKDDDGTINPISFTDAKKKKNSYVKNEKWEQKLIRAMLNSIKQFNKRSKANQAIQGKTDIFDIIETISNVGGVSKPSKRGIAVDVAAL